MQIDLFWVFLELPEGMNENTLSIMLERDMSAFAAGLAPPRHTPNSSSAMIGAHGNALDDRPVSGAHSSELEYGCASIVTSA